MFSDESLFLKYLPHNNMNRVDGDSDIYSSDHFRMYEFKVTNCNLSRRHDWTNCPFAHPGEKARRRNPRQYHYSDIVCPQHRHGIQSCSRGDACGFSHGVFECWLHPHRYRTEVCKDGKNCKRKVCFFAHTPSQLRVLHLNSHGGTFSCNTNKKSKFLHSSMFLHCNSSSASTCSPTSTMFGMAHFSSPPTSPSSSTSLANGFSPMSRFLGSEKKHHHGVAVMSYKYMLNELMSSLEDMNFNEANCNYNNSPVSSASSKKNLNLFDASSGFGRFNDDDMNAPDLGWVNDLLM